MCRRYAREGKTDRAFCILFIAPPEPALRRLWNSATVVSSPSRTTCQRRDTNQYIRMVTKNRDLLQKRRHKLHKRRASPRPLVRRKSRSKNTTPGPRGLVPNSSPRTSSDVVSGSPPLPKPTEVPPKYLLAMRAFTFQTTNRAFQRVSVASRASKEKSVAMTTNQGIASDVARRLHATLIPKPPLETTF